MLDLDCNAHERDNLYVADASFFPSINAVNPTLTIIANALRMADREGAAGVTRCPRLWERAGRNSRPATPEHVTACVQSCATPANKGPLALQQRQQVPHS